MSEVPLSSLISFVEEDAPFGDITSEAIIEPQITCAKIIARENLVIAGLLECSRICTHYGLSVYSMSIDGTVHKAGEIVMKMKGSAHTILLLERTLLNILGRMSGIASKTRSLQDIVSDINPDVKICATRKTAPGLRLLDKKAVLIGGGDPHRFSLSDAILIKDNHRMLIPVGEAIRLAKKVSSYHLIEAEADTTEEAMIIAESGVDIILLDNMSPSLVDATLSSLKEAGLRNKVKIEVSGGITEDNLRSYADLEIDLISLGILTHSVRNADLSLDILKPV
jgi:nicotinate-nucleotide pyrophosphorylase (carboxylating)